MTESSYARNSRVDTKLGNLDARMSAVERQIGEIAKDTRETRDAIIAARGGWKFMLAVGTICGMIGAAVTKAGVWIGMLPK